MNFVLASHAKPDVAVSFERHRWGSSTLHDHLSLLPNVTDDERAEIAETVDQAVASLSGPTQQRQIADWVSITVGIITAIATGVATYTSSSGRNVTTGWISLLATTTVATATLLVRPGIEIVRGLWLRLRTYVADQRRPDQCRCLLDLVMLHVLSSAARCAGVSGQTRSWPTRALVLELGHAAEEAETFAVRAVPLLDRPTRRAARADGMRLAIALRAHQAAVARAAGTADYQRIAASLTGGLLAWARGDFDALVADIPTPTLRTVWRSIGLRVGQAGLIAAAGYYLPQLPALHGSATTLQYTLWATAVISLFTGNNWPLTQITGALGRALPAK